MITNTKVNSYGAVSFAIIGILLIIIGVLLNILIKISWVELLKMNGWFNDKNSIYGDSWF